MLSEAEYIAQESEAKYKAEDEYNFKDKSANMYTYLYKMIEDGNHDGVFDLIYICGHYSNKHILQWDELSTLIKFAFECYYIYPENWHKRSIIIKTILNHFLQDKEFLDLFINTIFPKYLDKIKTDKQFLYVITNIYSNYYKEVAALFEKYIND